MRAPKSVEWVDARAASFGSMHHRPPDAFFREVLARVTSRTVVADAACGGGAVALWVAPRARSVTAADRDEAAVRAAAREAAARRFRNATFYQSDLEEESWTEWLPRTVGVCTLHRDVTPRILERAGESLPPGTQIVACALGDEQWREIGDIPQDAFTAEGLAQALDRAGFHPVSMSHELRVMNAPNLEVLETQFFRDAPDLVEAWRADGRWERLADRFDAGDGNLTESRLVACAVRR